MKKLIILFIGVILLLGVSIPAQASFQQIQVAGITGSANAASTAPVQYLNDNDPNTVWQSAEAVTGPLWVQLQLSKAAFIGGLQIYGPYRGKLNVEYWQNGGWHRFLAVRDLQCSSSGWNLIDVSYDRVVSERIRLALTADQPLVLGGIGEIRVLGVNSPGIQRLDPVNISTGRCNESNHPAGNLFDHNTYTSWWAQPGSPHDAETIADLGSTCTINRIKIYGGGDSGHYDKKNNGQFAVQYLANHCWINIPGMGNLTAAQLENTWQSFNLSSPITTDQIRIVLLGYNRNGGIKEVEIWGRKGGLSGSSYLYASQAPAILSANNSANYCFNMASPISGLANLHITGSGNPDTPVTWELNGRPMGQLKAAFSNNGRNFYLTPIDPADLWNGSNFIRVSGSELTLDDCRIELAAETGPNLAMFNGLTDRQQLTPNSGQSVIDLGGLYHIDELQFSYPDNQPGLQLAIDVNGQWVNLTVVPRNEAGAFGGTLTYSGIGLVRRIMVNVTTPECPAEVFIYGSRINDGPPRVHIDAPMDGDCLDLLEWVKQSLTGTVDNPDAELRVNGQRFGLDGTEFNIPLPALGLRPNESKELVVTATDGQGRTGSDRITISIGLPPGFDINLPDTVTYTNQTQITVTGQVLVQNSKVWVNDVAIPVVNRKFSAAVKLQEGINQITVKVTLLENLKISNIKQRWVVRSGNGPYLKVLSPVDGQVTKDASIQVSGEVSSLTPVQVAVNGKPATVAAGYFTSTAVPLVEGSNGISVIATDAAGTVTKATVNVKRDTTPPVLANITPADGSYRNTNTITINGTVTDASPVSVLVNQKAALVTGDRFSVEIPVNEGRNILKIEACDTAGNTRSISSGVFIDTKQPAEFTPVANPASWTHNTKPVIAFSTTDDGSGMDHYELQLNNGGWSSPVTSPYQFTTPIPDGEHTVTVKAVDKAGNERLGVVKVFIDTTPPGKPQQFHPVPGNGQITLKWLAPDPDVIEYRIIRTPAWPEPYRSTSQTEFNDSGLTNGEQYQYTIQAIDQAYNEGPVTESCEATAGLTVATYVPDKGAVVEYQNTTLFIHPGSLSPEIQSITVTEIESQELRERAFFPIISPMYQFSVKVKVNDTIVDAEHMDFTKDFNGVLQYDPSKIMEGFPEQNLGVYYYDPMWNRWFKVDKAGVDTEHHRIFFNTNHFSVFTVQPTMIEDITPQQLQDVGYSPFKTKEVHEGIIVSPEGGSAMTEMTELVLPGRNGFDFILKRTYDSATACGDAPGVSVNAQLGISIGRGVIDAVDLAKKVLSSGVYSLGAELEGLIKRYFQNNGDYAYSMGLGWRLNLPYIRGANSTILVRLPSGCFYSVHQMSLKDCYDVFAHRVLVFENHEGADFTLKVEQVRTDVSVTGLISGSQYIPGWQLVKAELILNDGTVIEMDALGRTTKITEPSGINVIRFSYSGLYLDYIQDSVGRKIRFDYTDGFLIPKIERIWVENDNSLYQREINYTLESAIGGGLVPLLKKAVDIGGREWNYQYDQQVLFNGGIGFKINFLATIFDIVTYGAFSALTGMDDLTIKGHLQFIWVFPLDYAQGPGIGVSRIYYDKRTMTYNQVSATDYLFGFIPVSIEFSFDMIQRVYVDRLEIYKAGQSSPIRRVNYSYSVSYHSHEQFYTQSATVNDGRTKVSYYYGVTVKRRNRWIDWSDLAAEQLNKGIAATASGAPLGFVNSFFTEDPYIYDVLTYNTAVVTCDMSGLTLESGNTPDFDTSTMRPLTQNTWHGQNSHRVTYRYDHWGNVIYQDEYSSSPERTNEVKSWMYYWPNSPASGAPWMGSPYQQAGIGKPRHNLPVGKIIANYTPVLNGSPSVTYLHTYYQYNSLGQTTGTAQWDGSQWLSTRMEYNSAFGNPTKKINPMGHETVYDYDANGLPTAVTEKAVRDVQGHTVDLVTRTGYEYISGLKLWEQDPRGYVKEYRYDALGRVTQITAPDDDDSTGWIPSGGTPGFRTNNPVTLVSYNDQQLFSIVTEPLQNKIRYNFNDLGKLAQIIKYQRVDGNYTPAAVTKLAYDNWNNLIAITDPDNNTTHYEYDAMGRNIAIRFPDDQGRNPVKRMDFDYNTNIMKVTDENGKESYEYQDMEGRTYKRTQYNGSLVIVTEHYFDGLGNEAITIDPKGGITKKSFNILNQLIRTDRPTESFWENGNKVTVTPYQRFQYDDAGYKIAEIHPLAGGSTEITNTFEVDELGRTIRTKAPYRVFGIWNTAITDTYYDGNGNKIKAVDANNTSLPYDQQKATTYQYSAANLLMAETDPAGNKTTYTYDKGGNRTSITDPRGNSGKYSGDFTIVYQYDDLKRLVTGLLPKAPGQAAKPVITLSYDARGNLLERNEPDGGKTSYTYTARNQVATQTITGNGITYTSTHKYDLAGNEITFIDPKGNRIEKEYDDLNQLKTVTFPEPNGRVVEHYSYDEKGNKNAFINGRSVTTRYEYDKYDNVVKITDGNQQVTTYRYDRWGNKTQVVNALGYATNYEFDELNRILQETDPAGFASQYGYDPAGNRLWSLDANGTMSRYTYTPNNLVGKVSLQNGETVKEINYLYDEAGYRTWVKYDNVVTQYNTDSSGYSPDPFGRIHKETKSFDGQSFTVGYEYDIMGRVSQVTYPNGQTVSYQYNSLGQLQSVPGFVDEAPEFDQGGSLKRLKGADGTTAGYTYDQNGRLTGLSYANQSTVLKSYTLKYDAANNVVWKNQEEFQYDYLNQLLFANLKGNFEISPDEEAQRIGKAGSDFKGRKSFEFELNQLDIIDFDYAAGSIGADLLAPVKITRVELQPGSPVHRVTSPSHLRIYYSQDNVTYTQLNGWKMVRKNKGVIEIVLDTPVLARFFKAKSMFDERGFNFDPVNQAQFTNTPQQIIHVYYLMDTRQEIYTYDALRNRKTETIIQRYPVARTFVYDYYSNRLKSNGKYTFEYDANGNLIKKETIASPKVTWLYTYDLFNRLIKVAKNNETITEYTYDESGLRIKKRSPATSVYYTFDTGGNVLYEQENRDYMQYIYVYGKHFARVDGNLDSGVRAKYFYHTDHLGSTVLVTDESGKQVWSAEYTPFGKQVSKDGKLDHVTQFTGKDLDEDTGLYYFDARWYDDELGRFITEDPNTDPNNINLYWYCDNNPMINIDPDGRESKRTDRQIFDNWMSTWIKIGNAAVDNENKLRTAIWKKDPVEYADNMWKFQGGRRDVFGSEYEKAADLRDYTTAIIGTAPEVLNWIENQVTMNRQPTFDEINNKAIEIAKAQEMFNTFIAPILYAGIGWAQMGGKMGNLKNGKGIAAEEEGVLKLSKSENASAKPKPYSNSKNRPNYGDGQVEKVWENAKQSDGKVYDPYTGEELTWDKTKSRQGQWDMGHKPGKEYRKLWSDYMDGKIDLKTFLKEFRNPDNYTPQSVQSNRSHKYEQK
jgi:RHS repeat-associated protein